MNTTKNESQLSAFSDHAVLQNSSASKLNSVLLHLNIFLKCNERFVEAIELTPLGEGTDGSNEIVSPLVYQKPLIGLLIHKFPYYSLFGARQIPSPKKAD